MPIDARGRTQTPDPSQAPLALAHPPQGPVVQFGQAYDSLAHGLDQVGAAYRKSQDEEARAWSSNILAESRLKWSQELTDRQANAEPNAPLFTTDYVRDFNAYAEEVLKKAPTSNAKLYLQQRLNSVLVEYSEKAKVFEANARIDYRGDQFNAAIDNSQKLMNTDPDQFQSVLAERIAEIESSSMPPIKKSDLRQKAIDRVSKAAVWSQMQRSPDAFLASIGFLGAQDPETGKPRLNSGDLQGRTGNAAFDMMPFNDRIQMLEQALRIKAQNGADMASAAKNMKHQLEDDATKSLWSLHADGKLNRVSIEDVRPVLSAERYGAFLKMLDKGGDAAKSDHSAFAHVQRLMADGKYGEAEKAAFGYHKSGLFSNSDLRSEVERAQSLNRQQGPKSPYEKERIWIGSKLDPGPMVPDPVARGRIADAQRTYDDWVQANPKATEEDHRKRATEIVGQYRLTNLGDTVLALPMPRSGDISRNVGDTARINGDIARAAKEAQRRYDAGSYTRAEYDNEMAITNQWRKAIKGQ